MEWEVQFTNKAAKQVKRLSDDIILTLQVLASNLAGKGPAPGCNWPNYGKLKGKKNEDKRHCHLIKGKPTYVCC